MKPKPVITLANVTKTYRTGHQQLLKQALLTFFRPQPTQLFYALADVTLSVAKGETVGIIGSNGSGKSTILKIIAGVTEVTKGSVQVTGRICPLIELGAGFHPELTGRDNIYLNAAILGLSKKEIDAKFATIVSFAELEQFIDTPVKHYSSGMYMRLGFSIAIYADPEILLVDEILAVGDTGFQKKCLQIMTQFRKQGITIVFVSHDLPTVQSFCDRVILLDHGKVLKMGTPQSVITNYQKVI